MNHEGKNKFSHTMLSYFKNEWYLLLLIATTLVIGLYVYPELPEKIPSHWNISGQVDGWSDKSFAVWFFPLLSLGIYIMMLVLPFIDPRRDNYQKFQGPYRFIRVFLQIFFAAIYMLSLLSALGYPIKTDLFIKLAVSLLFILLGNYMGKIQRNYFVGIKTPWTLANADVWQKTHRFAAPLWVTGGVLGMLLSFFQTKWAAYGMFAIYMVLAVVPILYSYILYRRTVHK